MRDALRAALAAYEPQPIEAEPGTPLAAVLLLLYEHRSQVHVIFQKRTDHVETHKGQVSFPGGMKDPGDRDLVHTGLRETHEEIGVLPADVEVLGQLDDILTLSRFRVTPYVGWLQRYPYEWRFSHFEVDYLLEVGLDHLRRPETLVPDRRIINGREIVLPSYQYREDLIWGATARMLTNFLDLVATADR
ncbi:MAG: CoA pyrophosphatase [Dehalococcoidia bacterium]|nr:CoA pyrophosphatase [Dehalococcoidia bacterium]NUQ54277.1 CoA pyrophosphatase [Dehalococcoidia bacterium]